MSSLVLRDPDPPRLGRKRSSADTEWYSLLSEAKKHPGKWWEVIPAYPNSGAAGSAAYDINTGRNQSVPEGEWEATARLRQLANGTECGVLYIKYIGPTEPPPKKKKTKK